MPATEAKGAQETQNHVVFLENFTDELQRKVPIADLPRKQFIRDVLFG
jgi:hypothetical protein